MEMNMSAFHDPFLRHIKDIEVPLGLTPFDAARQQPGPSLTRGYETVADTEQKDFPKSRAHILAKGAACGLDLSGQCCHFWPGEKLKFVGFLEAQTEDKAVVKTRGSVVLKVEGAMDTDRGKSVYCEGPNNFSLNERRGSVKIGAIRFVQGNRSFVAFKRFDDDRPLNLNVGVK